MYRERKAKESDTMDKYDILKRVDHTFLKQTAVWQDIEKLCFEAIKYKTASVCIPPCFVKACKDKFEDKVKICTVVGFPNGYNIDKVKAYETELALKAGADEIDMVINLTDVKEKQFKKIENEIRLIKSVCCDKILKVIVETCLLNDEEKIKLCKVVSSSGADYIKTSTGFAGEGANLSDIILFKNNVSPEVKIKAAGGIKDFSDAESFIKAGADRLGTSRLVKLMKD